MLQRNRHGLKILKSQLSWNMKANDNRFPQCVLWNSIPGFNQQNNRHDITNLSIYIYM